MTLLQRRFVLYGVLALAVLASYVAVQGQPDTSTGGVVEVASRKAPVQQHMATIAETLPLANLERPGMLAARTDPFAPKNWTPVAVAPTPPVQAAAPSATPAPPVAPALPFTYAGKVEEAPGKWCFYFVRGDDTFAVKKGELIGSDYRFDGIDGGNAVIQYLPVPTQQLLPIGANE